MAIGRHEPHHATGTQLKDAIRIGLDESLTALEESLVGLSDEQFWAFPLDGRHNIVTLVEHCIQCIDLYACEVHGRPLTFEAEERFDIWHFSPEQLRDQMTDLPTVADERERIAQLRRAVFDQLDTTAPEDLTRPNMESWWFEDQPEKIRADAYMRCICHNMAHLRQIWLLRGLLGLDDTTAWPEQHWA